MIDRWVLFSDGLYYSMLGMCGNVTYCLFTLLGLVESLFPVPKVIETKASAEFH